MSSPERRSKGIGWLLMYAFTGAVDLFQIIVSATGIGIGASEIVEFSMPFILIFIFQFIIKASILTKPARLASIAGALGLGAITGGIAPFWIVDVWYIHRSVKMEDAMYAEEESKTELLQNNIRTPLYGDGIRQPRNSTIETQSRSRNVDGIRPPNGGLR